MLTSPVVAELSGPRRNSRRRRLKWIAATVAGLVTAAGAIGWLGLQVTPDALPGPSVAYLPPATTALPDGLPPPVERFYRAVYGDGELPLYQGVVITGQGTMRMSGLTLPVRFRFVHDAGQDYRHYIEVTWFGRTVMTVRETFFDGTARLDLPFGISEGSKIDQGANLALWAEAIWMPAIWTTDARVSWSALDDQTALLTVPYGTSVEKITVRFDPETHLITRMESMRYQSEDADTKTLWTNDVHSWVAMDGWLVPEKTSLTWGDENSPWAILTTESVVYTAEIQEYLHKSSG